MKIIYNNKIFLKCGMNLCIEVSKKLTFLADMSTKGGGVQGGKMLGIL